MLKDEYWHTLFITDGERSTTMNFRNANLEYEMQEIIDVPFAVVEVSPTLKNHSHVADNDERRRLFSDYIKTFVNTNFDKEKANTLGLPSGRKRIFVGFKIDKNGKVRDVNVRGPHPDLEAEVKRIIKLLPNFAPGEHKGKPVTVPYTLPIIFEIQADSQDATEVPFSKVDKIPVHKNCENLEKEAPKKCTSQEVAKFVNQNFNMKLAESIGLKGVQRILGKFKIDKKGYVTSVVTRSSNSDLSAEAERVMNLIPRFIPGEHKGKKVTVSYALPIKFEINSKNKN